MSEPIQSLNKLLVDVPVGKGQDFLNTYGPGAQNRKPDYDNKVVFLHDTHTIFTQNDVFGGTEVSIGEHNSFAIDGTTYTLMITQTGQLSIEKYIASDFVTYKFNAPYTHIPSNSYCEYNTSYEDFTVSITPSNKISYIINHGTTNILLVGIQARNNGGDYTYVYGGSYTMYDDNNRIKYIDNIGYIGPETIDYQNSNIDSSLNINGTSAAAGPVSVTTQGAQIKANVTVSVQTTKQEGIIYYHELGQGNVKSKSFNIQSDGSTTIYMKKGYFTYVGTEWDEHRPENGTDLDPQFKTTKPESIHFDTLPNGNYAFIALPFAPVFAADGKTFIKPTFQGGLLPGGVLPLRVGGDIEDTSKDLVHFTHYDGDEYYVYRTQQAGLEAKDWLIYNYPS